MSPGPDAGDLSSTHRVTPLPRVDRASSDEAFFSSLAAELAGLWAAGHLLSAEELFARHLEVLKCPEQALEVIYEEVRLRRQRGLPASRRSLLRRFPQWEAALRVFFDSHELLDPAPVFPEPGQTLGEFELLAELGRGSTGRVYLARQGSLADRPVVLKLMAYDEMEHLSLARLQHTHIVPLHAIYFDEPRRLRALCLPYFGGATLAQVLEVLRKKPLVQRTGGDLVSALDQASRPDMDLAVKQAPTRELLQSLSYERAVCYLAASLADALAYAHAHGLVHLDVKPSNVLLAADGQPMLLDFHLARAPVEAGTMIVDVFGGTPAYMPPEQEQALRAVETGRPLPAGVDHRADLYSLAVLLYEALGGPTPYQPGVSRPLAHVHSNVSPGLSDLIARSLSPVPARRHASAADFAEDLRRHCHDLPLKTVSNRSWRERWQKWRRRRPSALRFGVLAGTLLLTLLGLGLLAGADVVRRTEEAEHALREGRRQGSESGLHGEALATLHRGLDLVERLPVRLAVAPKLRQEIEEVRERQRTARRQKLLVDLHVLAEQMRGLYGLDLPLAQRQALRQRCREFWDRRVEVCTELGIRPGSASAQDFLDIVLTWAGWLMDAEARAAASVILVEAARLFGDGAALRLERQETDTPGPAGSAWEEYALGRSLLYREQFALAEQHLQRALLARPDDRWTHFLHGQCAYRLQHYEEAVSAFSFCLGADPASQVGWYNRAAAYAALGRTELALADFDQALRLDPQFAGARYQRGLLHLRESRLEQAAQDLGQALGLGYAPAQVHFQLARVALARNASADAVRHLQQALRHDAAHAEAKQLLEKLRSDR